MIGCWLCGSSWHFNIIYFLYIHCFIEILQNLSVTCLLPLFQPLPLSNFAHETIQLLPLVGLFCPPVVDLPENLDNITWNKGPWLKWKGTYSYSPSIFRGYVSLSMVSLTPGWLHVGFSNLPQDRFFFHPRSLLAWAKRWWWTEEAGGSSKKIAP